MSQYTQIGINNANIQQLASTAVSTMTYEQISALCGITLGPNGESPEDFFYVAEANQIVASLKFVESQKAWDAEQLKLQNSGLTEEQIILLLGVRPE
jgi:hypothetical protein